MLPIIEEPEPEIDYKKATIFKTIVNDPLSNPRALLPLPSYTSSKINPSLMSAKSGKYWPTMSASTALDTNFTQTQTQGSERFTLRGTLNDKKETIRQELAIFCVDEEEREKDGSSDSQNKRLAKSFEKSNSSDYSKNSILSKRQSEVNNNHTVGKNLFLAGPRKNSDHSYNEPSNSKERKGSHKKFNISTVSVPVKIETRPQESPKSINQQQLSNLFFNVNDSSHQNSNLSSSSKQFNLFEEKQRN